VSGLELTDVPYVGFGIAFPWSDNAPSVDFRVNEIYSDLQMMAAFDQDSND
jgi:hypothetical protein